MRDVLGVRIVPPRDRNRIRKDAYQLREAVGQKENLWFPIMPFLEHVMPQLDPGFYVEPVEDSQLPGRMAETIPEQHTIRVRDSVYKAACVGHPWARVIMAHELGHYIYHDGVHVAYAHPAPGSQVPKQYLPEYQADVFAAELLAPLHLIRGMGPQEIKQKFGVNFGTAKSQLNQAAHTKAGKKKKKAAKHKGSAARQ